MKRIKTILSILVLALIVTSCNKPSLQKYLVDSQEKTGFITFDLPTSFLQLATDDVSEEVKTTLKSIRKVNVVALPYSDDNKEEYNTEKTKIKDILKNSDKYKSLMRMTSSGIKMNIYYTGTQDAIDEVIAFGYADDKGVGIARILGDDMNPAKIMEMMKNIKMDPSNLNLKQFNMSFD